MEIRDRVVEIKKIPAAELMDNEGNWRGHPLAQEYAMRDILREVGAVDVLKAYYSKRAGGALVLLDGHLRKKIDPTAEWNVAISDLTDEEADYILATHDTVTGMAEPIPDRVIELLDTVQTDSIEVREMLRKLEMQARGIAADELLVDEPEDTNEGPPEMDLLPFEHYDSVLLVFKQHPDWLQAISTFKLERKADPRIRRGEGPNQRIGLCRVIDGAEVVRRLVNAETAAG